MVHVLYAAATNKKSVSVKNPTKKKASTRNPISSNPPSGTSDLDQDQSLGINNSSEINEPNQPIGRKASKAAKSAKSLEAAESKKRPNNAGAEIAAANMKLANASTAKVKIAAMAAADARQALDNKIMLSPAPQDLDKVQMQYWLDRRAQIAKRLQEKNAEVSVLF